MCSSDLFGNDIEIYSIDEAFVDFSNIPQEELNDTLLLIKEEVRKKVGIPVSIGVGPNKTLAKLTSYLAKKSPSYNGVCSYWDIKNFRNLCYGIEIDEVWGIGRKWAKKLKNIGVESVGQFINTHEYTVKKLMNINGVKTLLELQELYCHPIQKRLKPKKNIASTRSFGKDVSGFDQLGEAMYKESQQNSAESDFSSEGNPHDKEEKVEETKMSKEVMEMRRLAGLPLNENYVYAQEEDDTPEPSTEQPEAHEPTPDDKAEYDQEGRMAKNHLSTMIDAVKDLEKIIQDNENLPEWVQDKITMATDYIDTVRDYMKSNDAEYTDEGAVNEEPNEGNEFSGELAKEIGRAHV